MYGVHSNNIKNLTRGIAERVLYVRRDGVLQRTPKPVSGVFSRLSLFRDALVAATPSTRVVPLREFPLLYSDPRKRSIYERAVASLSRWGLTKRDAVVNTFVKAEKVNFSAKPDPAPRVIQPRSPRYNAVVGRYLKLFEKQAFTAVSRVMGYQVILKGLNAQGVAKALRASWDVFRDPVAVGLDASRFDQHVSRDALAWEHSYYNAVFRSPELAHALSWQLRNVGKAYCGEHVVQYTTDGCRMSGDMNTGLGNCLIMVAIVRQFCVERGISHRLANNGDDCVLMVERADLPRLLTIDQWFLEFGFTLTREEPVDVFERMEFCQASPCWTSTGWRMVRNISTAPSKDLVSLLSWKSECDRRVWAGAVGRCGLELTRGVPVWEAFYRGLLAQGSTRVGGDAAVRRSGFGYMARGVQGGHISSESRVSFWRMTGITPSHQRVLEQELEKADYALHRPVVTIDTIYQQITTTTNPLSRCLAATTCLQSSRPV